MMKNRILLLVSSAVVIALVFNLVLVSPAQAVPPIPYFMDWGEGPFFAPINCGAFEVKSWVRANEVGQTFLDQDGKWVKSLVKVNWWFRFYREDTGKQIVNESHWSGGYKYDDQGQMTIAWGHGKILIINVPGYGPVFRAAGYIYQNYITGERIQDGPGDLEYGEFEGLCRYFAAP